MATKDSKNVFDLKSFAPERGAEMIYGGGRWKS